MTIFKKTYFRFTAAMLVFLLAFNFLLSQSAFADNEYHIISVEDLYVMSEIPDGSFILDCDLDMSGINWIPIPFSGTFDGGGHSIYNLSVSSLSPEGETTYDGNMNAYPDTRFAAFFSDASGAEIKNLRFIGADIDITTESDCFCAILCGYGIQTTVENCAVEGRVHLYSSGTNVGVAGIIGFGDADISDCSVNAELLFADRSQNGQKCELYFGGLLSCGVCNITGNRVELDGYISCNGYVHSGGLVGMMYRMKFDYVPKLIDGNTAAGCISFYENNTDRRAYCEGLIGEDLFHWIPPTNNDTSAFLCNEIFSYDTEVKPEKCETPDHADERVEASCTECGYTVHTCRGCGYSYIDSYVLPHHRAADEWEILRAPDYNTAGEKLLRCRGCGIVLDRSELPPLIPCSSCVLSVNELSLKYADTYCISAALSPADASEQQLTWSSSDESIVSVDGSGNVTALGNGTAVITCASSDGFASAQCRVSVSMNLWQRLLRLFGII